MSWIGLPPGNIFQQLYLKVRTLLGYTFSTPTSVQEFRYFRLKKLNSNLWISIKKFQNIILKKY